jgi:hypothetical protein
MRGIMQRQQQLQQCELRRDAQRSRSRGYPRLVFFTLIVIALIGMREPSNSAAASERAGSERSGCDGSTLVRRLTFVDQGRTDSATIEIARAEVESIWATAGVRLLWVSGAHGATPRPDAYVVLREGRVTASAMKDAWMMRSGWSNQLGWVRFDRHGARSHLLEVSLANVRLSLMYAWYDDARLASQPKAIQIRVLGRALGRIIAHELGHWLMGVGHEPEGLMKATLQAQELMAAETPRLPAAWTDLSGTSDWSDKRMTRLRALCG